MTDTRVPPRWIVRLAWSVHRARYRVLGRRVGLWRPGTKAGARSG